MPGLSQCLAFSMMQQSVLFLFGGCAVPEIDNSARIVNFDVSHFLILFVEGCVDLRAQSLQLTPIIGCLPSVGLYEIEGILLDAVNEESQIQQEGAIKNAGKYVFVDGVGCWYAVEYSHSVWQSGHEDSFTEWWFG